MTSLISYLSSDYQKAYNGLAPKSTPKSVLVYVEDIDDVSFWYSILNRHEKHVSIKFDIQPYSNNSLATGKKSLEKLFNGAGEYLIICLDSDYDYLIHDHSEISKEINKNPYIFQTYAYSTENLKCFAESLNNICVEATHSTTEKINFIELLNQYSKIIYELFTWNLYFYSIHDNITFTISEFNNIIKITEDIIIEEYGATALKEVEKRVEKKLSELKRSFQEHIPQVKLLAGNINELGLSNENAYFFVHGHTVYNNVVIKFLEKICKIIKEEHKVKIDIACATQDNKRQRLNHYRNIVSDVKTALSKNARFEECFLFKKINNDIEQYLNMHSSKNVII